MKIIKILGIVTLLFSLIKAESLDQLGVRFETDKSSQRHNYTAIYEQLFAPLRDKPIKFLEIGFCQGRSARMWDHYFSHKDTIFHFIDNDSWVTQHYNGLSTRCSLNFVDQANRAQLEDFITKVGGDFDVICEDGGHHMHQQINSFITLFPYVKSGGIYIIEDIHTSYWKFYGGYGEPGNPKNGPGTTVDFLCKLIDDLNFVGAKTECADKTKIDQQLDESLNYYQKHIKSITFFGCMCIITKE